MDSDFSNQVKMITDECTNEYVENIGNLELEHIDAHSEECTNKITNSTPIQNFYENQNILITGGTGFLGKVLILKLLRFCPRISRIFILIREKKGNKVDKRIQDFLQDPVFENDQSNMIDYEKKIYGIAGDCSVENLGLRDSDAELLKWKVSIVFHVAATVRFDEKLKHATAVNVQSTSAIIDLCKEMKNLKSFVHVSTTYANCFAPDIEEKFYNYPISHQELFVLVNTLSEKNIETITPQLIKPWPNTYTFTKALAEDLIRAECKSLPVAIFRPAIVTPSALEPLPGWIDNYNGAAGITAAVASGVLRTFHFDPKASANFVPVDLTVNALIASAWDLTSRKNRKADDMLIYNFTSANEAPLTWGAVGKYIVKYVNEYPLHTALWCAMFRLTKYKFVYYFNILFLHLIPAYFADFGIRIIGQNPRLIKTYARIHRMSRMLSHFGRHSWRYRDDNVKNMWNSLDARDQQMFPFSMLEFDWEKYFATYIVGIRVFLFKDDSKTLEASRKRYKRLLVIHNLITAGVSGFFCWILWRASLSMIL